MGDGSSELKYWWQVCWKTWNPEIHRWINDLPKDHPDKLWINKLKFTAIIVNIFAASAALESHHTEFNWQSLLHMGGENTSANCWASKFYNSNKFAQRLTKLLVMVQKNLGIDVIIDHVIGILNGFSDAVSRGDRPSHLIHTSKSISPLTQLFLLVYRWVLQWNRSLWSTFSQVQISCRTSLLDLNSHKHTYVNIFENGLCKAICNGISKGCDQFFAQHKSN